MNLLTLSTFFWSFINLTKQHDLKGFDDSILFDIGFPGLFSEEQLENELSESMFVTTSMNEKFRCILPNVIDKEETKVESYSGPGPLELLLPLFTQSSCSYRIDSYWTYEVCHGRYIRQFHEDREGKKVKLQEYSLGKWDANYLEQIMEKVRAGSDQLGEDAIVPTKKIDNVNKPYFDVIMENGTACDLNSNKPRSSRVIYVCSTHGKHEVHQIKETSTCSYEIVILTSLLCTHPKFTPKDIGNLKIQCVPTDGGAREPYNLAKLNRESAKLRKNADLNRLKLQLIQFKSEDAITGDPKAPKFVTDKVVDNSPVKQFLRGKHCLYGGSGWWKFEFCYGKSVEQFHIEKDGFRTSINLGMFDKQKHLDWIKENPHKRPKPIEQRKQLSHFYSDGSICDKTNKPRQTEVKLKCLENAANPSSVSLYLLEPKYCEYTLGVESPLICEILEKADENGLVEIPADLDDEEEYTTFTIKL